MAHYRSSYDKLTLAMKKVNKIDGKLSKTTRRDFLRSGLVLGAGGLFIGSSTGGFANTNIPANMKKRKLKPVLDGDWWLIGPPPPQGKNNIPVKLDKNGDIMAYESVDHHIFQAEDGYWHLWGCVRKTGWGRILYHWKAKSLIESPWEDTGEFIRANAAYGESINGWEDEEWIQSPYFVKENGTYYMFYGGHSIGRTRSGAPARDNTRAANFNTDCQICIMTSSDGLHWSRHTFEDGLTRAFYGPGEARDPCLIKVNNLWYLYYTGLEDGDPAKGGMFVRTSEDLLHWSGYKLVHRSHQFGSNWWEIECPHVVYREGYFYLFRTQHYGDAITHVFRSEDLTDFGTDDHSAKNLYVGEIACGAPEIYQVEGEEFISSNHNPPYGTQLSRLKWEAV